MHSFLWKTSLGIYPFMLGCHPCSEEPYHLTEQVRGQSARQESDKILIFYPSVCSTHLAGQSAQKGEMSNVRRIEFESSKLGCLAGRGNTDISCRR